MQSDGLLTIVRKNGSIVNQGSAVLVAKFRHDNGESVDTSFGTGGRGRPHCGIGIDPASGSDIYYSTRRGSRIPDGEMAQLSIAPSIGLEVVSCGLFISSGKGTHPDRVLDNYELIVVRKGTLSLWEDDERLDIPPGYALLLYPGRRHRGAAPFGRDLSFYWIHFLVKGHRPQGGLEIPRFIRVERPDCVAELFHRYLDDQEARRLDSLYSAALLVQILCEVGRRPPELKSSRGALLVGRAEAYIVNHFSEKLSTARIARAIRVNPDYLNRVFREVHCMTVTEYIHRRRLNDAAAMLRGTADTVVEIASACGYPSTAHFRRMFERYRGVSPVAYRRLMARAYVNTR
jgi:AraC-like DNA-binding protein